MKKRVLAIAMTLAMTLSLLPVSALATETGETPEEETSTVNSIQETNSSENAENQDQELTADVEIDEDTQVTEGDSVENFVAKIGDMPYATLQGAINAASDNATIVLQDDVVLDTCITISKTITLDLAGNKISNTEAVWDNEGKIWSLVRVEGNGNLTLTGDGTLRALEDDCYAVDIVDGGQCTIENGTYVGNIHAVYVFNGSLIVNGGTFSVQQKYSTERPDEYVLNCYDANYNNKSASITVTGGTFANFDPSNCYAEGEGTNFCADGYVSVQDGEQYVVMPIKDAAVAQIGNEYYLTLGEAISHAQNDETVTLLDDITSSTYYVIGKNITLDLNGHTLTSSAQFVLASTGGTWNLKNGALVSTYDAGSQPGMALLAQGGTVNIGNVDMTVPEGCYGIQIGTSADYDNAESDAKYSGHITIGGGSTINSKDSGIIIVGRKTAESTLIVNDADITATTFAISGNGSNDNTQITITGGNITSKEGPVIYHPQAGDLTITGGILTGVNGVQYCGAGTLTISDDAKITATGDYTEYPTKPSSQGDGSAEDGAAVSIISRGGGYQDNSQTMTVNISGGTLISENNAAIAVYRLQKVDGTWTTNENTSLSSFLAGLNITGGNFRSGNLKNAFEVDSIDQDKVTVSGGYFTSDPSDYLASSFYAVASDKTGYSWMVTDSVPPVAPVVVMENVDAAVGENVTEADAEKIQSVIDSASVSGVADALKNNAKNSIIARAGIDNDTLTDPNNKVVVEISVSVTATSASLSGNDATVTYQVTPVAIVKVNGEEQKGDINVPNDYLSGQEFTVRLPLPEGLKSPKEVMHIADTGARERFTGSELTIGSNWVEVSISHFSELIVNAKETVAAKIGNTEYGTLQEAVSAAASGATITLQQDCDEPITISGKSVKIDRNDHKYEVAKITLGSRCEMTVNGDVIVITYTAPTHSSDSDSGSDSGDYLITVDRVSGGRVTVQPGRADKGDTVTITVYPNDGYELDELVVTDSRGNEIDLDARSATRFTFTMPGGKVTVEASFVREGGQTQTPQTTFADVPASAWYCDAVEYVYENGLMSGVSGGRFAPDDTLTRAMLVQTLYAMEGRPASASAGFADVASGDWYASAVNWAAANGVVSGVSETGFGPNNALTREQLALILYRFAQYKGYDVTGTSDLAAYADGSSVSGWAAEAMGWAVDAGLISGVGGNQIAPTGTASRAQVAQILMNFCENVAR